MERVDGRHPLAPQKLRLTLGGAHPEAYPQVKVYEFTESGEAESA